LQARRLPYRFVINVGKPSATRCAARAFAASRSQHDRSSAAELRTTRDTQAL
jgi:hypothetical protein